MPWAWVRTPDAIGGLEAKPRAYFELKEGWVDRVSALWDLRVGNQIITWGAADQINPTDQWNPRDMADPINSFKLPMPTAKFNLHPQEYDQLALEILATPFFRESKLPVVLPSDSTVKDVQRSESRWLMPLPTHVSLTDFSAPLYFKIAEPTYPATWQAAARLQIMRIEGWDFSTSYFNGVEKLPRTAI